MHKKSTTQSQKLSFSSQQQQIRKKLEKFDKDTPRCIRLSLDPIAEDPSLDNDDLNPTPLPSPSKGKQKAVTPDPFILHPSQSSSFKFPIDKDLEQELSNVDQTLTPAEQDEDEEPDSDSDSDVGEDVYPNIEDFLPPEKKTIPLPSNSDLKLYIDSGNEFVLAIEADLRMGEMNDTLEKLRVILGTRSVLMKKTLRGTQGGSGKTRAWAEINNYTRERNLLVRYYLKSRHALEQLGTHPELLETTYKPIKATDLKVTGDIVEENRFGQQSDTLPWFWRLDKTELLEDSNVMNECRFSLSCIPSKQSQS